MILDQGYWVSKNYDYMNGMFTADCAYDALQVDRETNWTIPHVVAGAWGVDFSHPLGEDIVRYMCDLAKRGAFRGPHAGGSTDPRVVGHRHDQTALSVVAWRLGLALTEMPVPYAEDSGATDQTILVARR